MSPAAPRRLAVVALLLGGLAPFARDPFPGGRRPAAPASSTSSSIAARALAERLRAREPGLRILDLRSVEREGGRPVPTAERFAPGDPAFTSLPADATLVVYADSEADAEASAAALRASGHRDVRTLRGGMDGWRDDVLSPALDPALDPAERSRIAELSRYFGGQPRPGTASPPAHTDRPRLAGRGC